MSPVLLGQKRRKALILGSFKISTCFEIPGLHFLLPLKVLAVNEAERYAYEDQPELQASSSDVHGTSIGNGPCV